MKTTKKWRDDCREQRFDLSHAEIADVLDDLDTALARVKVLEDALEKMLSPRYQGAFVMIKNAHKALARSRALGESKDEVVE